MQPVLDIRSLKLTLPGEFGLVTPVDEVGFQIFSGECVGLVGESGCGKSLTAQSLLGLTRILPGAKVSGAALWQPKGGEHIDLLKVSEARMSRIRGKEISMVFQDPLSSLNPLLRIDYQIKEVLNKHLAMKGEAASRRVVELLSMVGVPQPEQRAQQYPHQLSGGLRQRALLALALAGGPDLLIADEPTTALDVTIQAQILRELRGLQQTEGMSILFITHDLGVVAQLCSRVLVMYAGRIVESAPVGRFFDSPSHPYSKGLLASLPSLAEQKGHLTSIPGSPPRPDRFPDGCRFHPRCPDVEEKCKAGYPPLESADGQSLACWVHGGKSAAAELK